MIFLTKAAGTAHQWVALFVLVLAACGVYAVPAAAQSPSVDDETCLGCHDQMAATLERTAHHLGAKWQKLEVALSCSACHAGGEVHVDDPSAANITNPATAGEEAVLHICSQCHSPHMELDSYGFDPHVGKDVTCVSCHKVHGGEAGLLKDRGTEFCATCHVAMVSEVTRRSTHPINDGDVTCLSCHTFTGAKGPDFGQGAAANCYECHPEQSGPYLWEHEATSSFSPEGVGCVACHAPHGSANDRLLVQPGDVLCQSCHGTPPLHLVYHDGIGSQYACLDCHSDIHGSNVNRGLLDPNLGAKINGTPASCYCHGADR